MNDRPADEALLRGVRRGEQSAMADLYDRYSALIYSVALRMLRSPAAAEDVLQEVLLQLWRAPQMFDGARGSLAAWLTVLARNRSIDVIRKSRRLTAVDEFDVEAGIDVEDDAIRNDVVNKVRAVLSRMPPAQKQAVEMAVFEGKTHSEIAAELNTPLGTVKTRIRTALQLIKSSIVP